MNKNVVSLAHSCAKRDCFGSCVCFFSASFFSVVVVVGSSAFIFAARCNSVEHINVFACVFFFGKSCSLFLQFNALSFNAQWKALRSST